MRRWARIFLLVPLVLLGSGHVGSREILYQGPAGPYTIRVVVIPPSAIPGPALVHVRSMVLGIRSVTLRPVRWDLDASHAAAPEVAAADSDGYRGVVWLMSPGSYGLHVTVTGDRGEGMVVVPVPALALERKPLGPGATLLLTAMLGLLATGAVGTVRGVAREASLPPGAVVGPAESRRGRRGLAVAVVVVGGLLALWTGWWNRMDTAYGLRLYRPPAIEATIVPVDDGQRIELAVQVEPGGVWRPLIADHGRVMHLFLVREPGLDVLAHLHPRVHSDTRFGAPLPPLPPGRYRVYADVVHDDGLAETLTATVELTGQARAAAGRDPEDAWWTAADDDGVMWTLADSVPVVGEPTELRVGVHDATGKPAMLEPYLGMAGHAVVTRPDGAVFVHLHPEGTASRAAQQRLGDAGKAGHLHQTEAGTISFPYLFPAPGRYRLWVQVRVEGVVRTGVFDLDVGSGPAVTRRADRPGISLVWVKESD